MVLGMYMGVPLPPIKEGVQLTLPKLSEDGRVEHAEPSTTPDLVELAEQFLSHQDRYGPGVVKAVEATPSEYKPTTARFLNTQY